jgi:hypothetical protein
LGIPASPLSGCWGEQYDVRVGSFDETSYFIVAYVACESTKRGFFDPSKIVAAKAKTRRKIGPHATLCTNGAKFAGSE